MDRLSRNDIPVAGDFDGDGRIDAAVVQPLARLGGSIEPNASVWVIIRTSDGTRLEVPFGAAGVLDRPAPGDFDGDGITDIATFRANSDLTPGAAEWFILPSSTGAGYRVAFGAAGGADLPAVADFDGDGRADIATFRPIPTPLDESRGIEGVAQWFILPSGRNDGRFTDRVGGFPVTFGAAGNADQPILADFNGDGRADIATFRSVSDLEPGRAQWFILPSSGDAPGFGDGFSVIFGQSSDIASVGDYNGDGRPDYAVYEPDRRSWTIDAADSSGRNSGNPSSIAFGVEGGVPALAPLFFRLAATENLGPASIQAARQTVPDSPGRRVDREALAWRNHP